MPDSQSRATRQLYPAWTPPISPTGFNDVKLLPPGNVNVKKGGTESGCVKGATDVLLSIWPQLYPILPPTYKPVQGSTIGALAMSAFTGMSAAWENPRPKPMHSEVPASSASLVRY